MRDAGDNFKIDTNLFGQTSESHRAHDAHDHTLILSAADYFNTPKAKRKDINLGLTSLTIESEPKID